MPTGENDAFVEMEALIIEAGVAEDDRRWLLAFDWLSKNIPLIESEAQCNGYISQALVLSEKLAAEGLEPGMSEFARSPDGRMVSILLAAIDEWRQRTKR